MVEEVIAFLAKLPTATTSPVYLAVNTAGMLSEQGGRNTAVYTTAVEQPALPFVRLWAGPERIAGPQFLGGANKSFNEDRFLMAECAAYGATDQQAAERAAYLKMAVEGAVQKALSANAIAARADLGGTTSEDRLSHFQIVPAPVESEIQGPGNGPSPLWEATAIVRVAITVHHQRSA